MSEKEKGATTDLKREEVHEENVEAFIKKSQLNETEQSRKQESRMMNFFNQEFFDRKIDFKPKKTLNDHKVLHDDFKSVIPNAKIYDRLLEIEKEIDEKMYKTRLDIQESLILPTPKVKALLRTHIFSYFTQNPEIKFETKQENLDNNNQMEVDEIPILYEKNIAEEYIWVLRIQGKIMPVLEEQPGGFYRKFSYFFNKIEVDFDHTNARKYDKVEWVKSANPDTDGFEIKRTAKTNDEIKLRISFHVNYYTPEYQVSNELAKLIGIKQDTRPKILNHIWQYIKLNSLQDNENPNMIINNRELQSIFRCERMDVTSLTARLVDHVKLPEPIVIYFKIKPIEDWTQNQKLYDIIVNIDDPHFLDISNFLSNSENESVLFPKSLFFYKNENQKNEKSQTETEKFYNKLQDYERNTNELMEKLKKHKYKFDFYDSFAKDPTRFINNFLIQQNSLLKIMKEESSIIDARWDYNSAQYYKDYEDVLKEYVDLYMNKLQQA